MYVSAPFTFDFGAQRVRVGSGTTEVDVTALYTAVKEAQASEEGILFDAVASGSGLVDLGGGVRVGLTVELLGGWQVEFAAGAYIARVTGGNLVGGPGGDPIAYSAGVQTLLIQSAASTVVDVGSSGASGGLTADQAAQLLALAKVHGLVHGVPLQVSAASRTAGDVVQSITEVAGVVTVERV